MLDLPMTGLATKGGKGGQTFYHRSRPCNGLVSIGSYNFSTRNQGWDPIDRLNLSLFQDFFQSCIAATDAVPFIGMTVRFFTSRSGNAPTKGHFLVAPIVDEQRRMFWVCRCFVLCDDISISYCSKLSSVIFFWVGSIQPSQFLTTQEMDERCQVQDQEEAHLLCWCMLIIDVMSGCQSRVCVKDSRWLPSHEEPFPSTVSGL